MRVNSSRLRRTKTVERGLSRLYMQQALLFECTSIVSFQPITSKALGIGVSFPVWFADDHFRTPDARGLDRPYTELSEVVVNNISTSIGYHTFLLTYCITTSRATEVTVRSKFHESITRCGLRRSYFGQTVPASVTTAKLESLDMSPCSIPI